MGGSGKDEGFGRRGYVSFRIGLLRKIFDLFKKRYGTLRHIDCQQSILIIKTGVRERGALKLKRIEANSLFFSSFF